MSILGRDDHGPMTTFEEHRRPKSLKIGPLDWDIRYDADLSSQMARNSNQDEFGRTRPDMTDIIIDPRRSKSGLRETVLHEALHACMWTYGVDVEAADDEEAVVAPLASAVLDLLRHNPALVAMLTEDD